MAGPIVIPVPDTLASELESASQEFLEELLVRGLREIKIDRALELYVRGGMSFGAAAERAGISQPDLARFARARGIEPLSSPETLAEELGGAA